MFACSGHLCKVIVYWVSSVLCVWSVWSGKMVWVAGGCSESRGREGRWERENTVELPNKGHFGANSFVPCREVVPISEVK